MRVRLDLLGSWAACVGLGIFLGNAMKREANERRECDQELQKMRALKERFQVEASVDGLTRIYNRAYFETRLHKELRLARDLDRELTLAFLDLDEFKRVNDVYGHLTGDRTLRLVAHAIRDSVRQADVVARYGGEEFTILMPGTPKLEAHEAGERIIREVAARTEQALGFEVRVSVGIASCPDDAHDAATLVDAADTAMYRAKKAVKNEPFYPISVNDVRWAGHAPRPGDWPRGKSSTQGDA